MASKTISNQNRELKLYVNMLLLICDIDSLKTILQDVNNTGPEALPVSVF